MFLGRHSILIHLDYNSSWSSRLLFSVVFLAIVSDTRIPTPPPLLSVLCFSIHLYPFTEIWSPFFISVSVMRAMSIFSAWSRDSRLFILPLIPLTLIVVIVSSLFFRILLRLLVFSLPSILAWCVGLSSLLCSVSLVAGFLFGELSMSFHYSKHPIRLPQPSPTFGSNPCASPPPPPPPPPPPLPYALDSLLPPSPFIPVRAFRTSLVALSCQPQHFYSQSAAYTGSVIHCASHHAPSVRPLSSRPV